MKAISVVILMFLSVTTYAQEKKLSNPTSKIIIDNGRVKVTEYESQPGKDVCGLGSHAHPAHLTVLLTEATVTVSLPNGKTMTQKLPAGTTFWSEAETHSIINSGQTLSKVQIIEYPKQ
jgi:hypothetical protein